MEIEQHLLLLPGVFQNLILSLFMPRSSPSFVQISFRRVVFVYLRVLVWLRHILHVEKALAFLYLESVQVEGTISNSVVLCAENHSVGLVASLWSKCLISQRHIRERVLIQNILVVLLVRVRVAGVAFWIHRIEVDHHSLWKGVRLCVVPKRPCLARKWHIGVLLILSSNILELDSFYIRHRARSIRLKVPLLHDPKSISWIIWDSWLWGFFLVGCIVNVSLWLSLYNLHISWRLLMVVRV